MWKHWLVWWIYLKLFFKNSQSKRNKLERDCLKAFLVNICSRTRTKSNRKSKWQLSQNLISKSQEALLSNLWPFSAEIVCQIWTLCWTLFINSTKIQAGEVTSKTIGLSCTLMKIKAQQAMLASKIWDAFVTLSVFSSSSTWTMVLEILFWASRTQITTKMSQMITCSNNFNRF